MRYVATATCSGGSSYCSQLHLIIDYWQLVAKLLKVVVLVKGWSVHVSITLVDITASVIVGHHHKHHSSFREIL